MLIKQEILLGKGTRVESRRVRERRRIALPQFVGFMVMGLVSGWSLANRSNSVFPGGALIAHPRWMLARGILGSGWTGSVSSRPFQNSSGWWWLISSLFLIRISCHKATHANGYYGAWPGWAVSISVLPLTVLSACLTSALRWASQDKPIYQLLPLPHPLPLPSPSPPCSIFFPGKSSLTIPLQPRPDWVVLFYFPLHPILPAPYRYHRL